MMSTADLRRTAFLSMAAGIGSLCTPALPAAEEAESKPSAAATRGFEMRMQGIVLLGGFLKLTPFTAASGMSDDKVYAGVEKALRKYFGKRGEQVVQDNLTCVKRGYSEMQEIPAAMMK